MTGVGVGVGVTTGVGVTVGVGVGVGAATSLRAVVDACEMVPQLAMNFTLTGYEVPGTTLVSEPSHVEVNPP
jgi:hypothetical protein